MNNVCLPPRSLAFGLILAALSPAAFGQAADQAAVPPANQPASSNTPSTDEVLTLPTFEVSGDQAHGYVASQSTTGTRIASNIADLPFDVDVVTQPFLKDFADFDQNSALRFVAGYSPSEVTGQYQLRGFSSSTELIDGFRRIGLIDVADVDRIEIIKGPDASIYGAIQPGGVVDYITPQPTTVPAGEIGVVGGGEDMFRTSAWASGPLNSSGTLFYRVSAAYQYNDYGEQFASTKTGFESVKLLYKPDNNTSITLDFEHDEYYQHPFNQDLTVTEKRTMPWAGDSITESQYYGMVGTSLLDYDYAGPESYDVYRMTSGTVTIEHQFNSVWNLKLGVNTYNQPYFDQLVGSGAYYPYGTGNITFNSAGQITNASTPEVKDQPQVDFKPQKGSGAQLDNLFHFKTGPVDNKLLVTADYFDLNQRTQTFVPEVNGTQATDYYAVYSPYNPSGASYYTPQTTWDSALGYGWNTTLYDQNPALYNALTADQWTDAKDYGLMASEHISALDDRLNLLAGGRYDMVRNDVANYNIPAVGNASSLVTLEPSPYQAFDYETHALTYQLGGTFQIVKGINIYANKSTAFNPQPQIDADTGLALPNNTSNGYDYGFKTVLINQTLNLTVDRFAINEYNLAQTETDPVSGQKDTILSGQQTAKGYETTLQYQVTNDLLIEGDWGYVATETVNSPVLTFYDGLAVRRVPRNNAGLLMRYQISHGMARGLFFTADGSYQSKSLVNLGSGKSLIPGPSATTANSTVSMYYVPSLNETFATGKDPKDTGEVKITATPFINAPFPGSGVLPYSSEPANAVINFPMSALGQPLPLANPNVPGVYSGEAEGIFVDDGREFNFNAPNAVFDLGAGYTWKTGWFSHTVQVNIKNLLNRKYTYGSGVPGNPFQILVSYYLDF